MQEKIMETFEQVNNFKPCIKSQGSRIDIGYFEISTNNHFILKEKLKLLKVKFSLLYHRNRKKTFLFLSLSLTIYDNSIKS